MTELQAKSTWLSIRLWDKKISEKLKVHQGIYEDMYFSKYSFLNLFRKKIEHLLPDINWLRCLLLEVSKGEMSFNDEKTFGTIMTSEMEVAGNGHKSRLDKRWQLKVYGELANLFQSVTKEGDVILIWGGRTQFQEMQNNVVILNGSDKPFPSSNILLFRPNETYRVSSDAHSKSCMQFNTIAFPDDDKAVVEFVQPTNNPVSTDKEQHGEEVVTDEGTIESSAKRPRLAENVDKGIFDFSTASDQFLASTPLSRLQSSFSHQTSQQSNQAIAINFSSIYQPSRDNTIIDVEKQNSQTCHLDYDIGSQIVKPLNRKRSKKKKSKRPEKSISIDV